MISLLGKDLLSYLSHPAIIIGLILLILGLSTAVLAKRLTRVGRKKNNVNDKDAMLLTFKIVGIACMSAGFLTIAITLVIVIAG